MSSSAPGAPENYELPTQAPPAYSPAAHTERNESGSNSDLESQNTRHPGTDELEDDEAVSVHRANSIDDSLPEYIGKPPPYTPPYTLAKRETYGWPAWMLAAGAYVKRHKFFVATATFVIVALAVIMPCVLILHVFKDRAQSLVNDTYLKDSGSITRLFLDGRGELHLYYAGTLVNGGKSFQLDTISGQIYMTDTLPAFTPLANISSKDVDVDTSSTNFLSLTSDDLSHTPGSEVPRFFTRLLSEKSVPLGTKGTAKVQEPNLPKYDVAWDKPLAVPGFGGAFEFVRPPYGYGSVMYMTANANLTSFLFEAKGMIHTPNLNLTAGTGYMSLELGRIAVDAETEGGELLGRGELAVEVLPDESDRTSEVRIVLDGPGFDTFWRAAQGYAGRVMPWVLRPTGVRRMDGDEGMPWLEEGLKGVEIRMVVEVEKMKAREEDGLDEKREGGW